MAKNPGVRPDVSFEPVSATRMSGDIVKQIREAIKVGHLTIGDRLPSERALAEQFEVSRVTVRDALRVLEVWGLVEVRVGSAGGAFVTAPSPERVKEGLTNLMRLSPVANQEVSELRLVTELAIVTLAVVRATEEDLQELESLCERSRASLQNGTNERWISGEFHGLLARAAGNRALEVVAASFRGSRSSSGEDVVSVPRRVDEQSVAEHEEITAAIRARDADRARAALGHHLCRGVELPSDGTVEAVFDLFAIPQRPTSTARGRVSTPSAAGC